MIESTYGKHSPEFLRGAADALAGNVSATGVGFIRPPTKSQRRSADPNGQPTGIKPIENGRK
jgi:hypothetical protein